MPSLFALASPFALLLPLLAGQGDTAEPAAPSAPQCAAGRAGAEPTARSPAGTAPALPAGVNPLSALRQSAIARQVRIEQRVVVRIAPANTRRNLLADLPSDARYSRFEERGKEKCVALGGIAGVQTGSGNRLVLFLRDRRMLSVNLEKACRARDFYSGFYVEKTEDGRLCASRDKLLSRSGARCEVEVMRRLVEVRE